MAHANKQHQTLPSDQSNQSFVFLFCFFLGLVSDVNALHASDTSVRSPLSFVYLISSLTR